MTTPTPCGSLVRKADGRRHPRPVDPRPHDQPQRQGRVSLPKHPKGDGGQDQHAAQILYSGAKTGSGYRCARSTGKGRLASPQADLRGAPAVPGVDRAPRAGSAAVTDVAQIFDEVDDY